MKRALISVGLVAVFTAQVWADVTLKQSGTGKGMGMSATMATTTYIKGMKMRVDTVNGNTTNTTIYDVENQKMYIFDSKKKEADVWDMTAVSAEMSKSVQVDGISATITPNGRTKEIGGKTAHGYDMNIVVPATVGGSMEITMTLTGQTFIVKGAPGTADYQAFYRAAGEKGWIFSDPKAAKGSPGQARAMAEMYEEFAKLDGLPYETEMKMAASGGPIAALMSRMGMSATTVTESADTGSLAADLFGPPAGYKLNQRK